MRFEIPGNTNKWSSCGSCKGIIALMDHNRNDSNEQSIALHKKCKLRVLSTPEVF